MNPIERIRCTVLLAALALASQAGCSMPKAFSLDSAWPFGDDKPKPELPNRVACMWTDTVLHKAGEKPQRGFGGRLMFYGKDVEKPVLVDGELVVYAFDETGREPTDNKPTRRYVFPADQLPLHQSEGPVGPSYSFWLPWDEAGGPQTEVSLICRFHPKVGAVVISEQTKQPLPGALRPAGTALGQTPPKLPDGVPSRPARPQLSSQLSSAPAASGAQQASYAVAATNTEPNVLSGTATQGAEPIEQMRTTSIALPRDFQIPRGAAPVDMNGPNVKQIIPPAQLPPSQPMAVPQIAPAATSAVQTPVPGQRALGSLQAARFAAANQPQARAVAPAVYNPIYASAGNYQGSIPPAQVPGPYTMQPPAIAQPQLAPQPGHGVQHAVYQVAQHVPQQTTPAPQQSAQQLPPQFDNGIPAVISPQTAAQMIQIPTTGTATVTYQ
jgi:hypothetical protein